MEGPPLTSDRPGAPARADSASASRPTLRAGLPAGAAAASAAQVGGLPHHRDLAEPCPGGAVAADHRLDVALHLLGQAAERDDRDPVAEQQVADQRREDLGRELPLLVQLALEVLALERASARSLLRLSPVASSCSETMLLPSPTPIRIPIASARKTAASEAAW